MARRGTQRQYVYHLCARCGTVQPLSEMTWRNGILVCTQYDCRDQAVLGSRDINVARRISVWRHELEADRKLTEPVDRKADQSTVLY